MKQRKRLALLSSGKMRAEGELGSVKVVESGILVDLGRESF